MFRAVFAPLCMASGGLLPARRRFGTPDATNSLRSGKKCERRSCIRGGAPMSPEKEKRVWPWLTLILSCVTIVAFIFLFWELVEEHFFRDLDYRQLHYLYITRGVSSSLILAGWAAWFVLRERRKSEEELRRSGERHQAMLAHAADAIVLFDSDWK